MSTATAPPETRRLPGLGIVFALAALVRVVALALQPGLTYDGTYYLRQAERLAHGHFNVIGFPPGFPCLVALVTPLVGDPVLAARLVSLVAGLATLGLALSLARGMLTPRAAFVVGVFLALDPDYVRTSVEVLSEPLYGALLCGALVAFRARRDAMVGALLGLAFLVRPEAAIVLAALLYLRARETKRVPWQACLGWIPVVAYAGLASHAVGHPVLTPKQDQWDLGAATWQRAGTLLWTLHGIFPIVLVPGAVWWAVRHDRSLLVPLLPTVLLPFFAIHIQERFHVPALPMLAILAAAWVESLGARPRRACLVLAAVACAAGTAPRWHHLVRPEPLTPRGREIGTALRSSVRFDDQIAARFPIVPYYAGAGFVRAPRTASYEAMLDSVRAAGATHLLVLENETAAILPQLRPLFDNAQVASSESRLEAVAWVDAPVGARALLYRFRPVPVPAESVRVLASDVVSLAWNDPWLCTSDRGGRLRIVEPGEFGSTPLPPGREPSAGAGDAAIVTVRNDGLTRWICSTDLRTGHSTEFAATRGDAPAWPAATGDAILYVRTAPPGGLRALDPESGEIRPVRFAAIEASVARPVFITARGRDLSVTFERGGKSSVVATGEWPGWTAGHDTLDVPGRWATALQLHDPRTAWVPDTDALFASVTLADSTPDVAALCVVQGATLRRLTYGVVEPRAAIAQRRAGGQLTLVFVAGRNDLCRAPLRVEDLRIPTVRVFPAPSARHESGSFRP